MRRFVRDNGLTIAVFALFAVFLVGQTVAGFNVYLNELKLDGQAPIGFVDYLISGHFIEATFENWESEFLQMGALVVLSVSVPEGLTRVEGSGGQGGGRPRAGPDPTGRPLAGTRRRPGPVRLRALALARAVWAVRTLVGAARHRGRRRVRPPAARDGCRPDRHRVPVHAGVLVPVHAELAERVPVRRCPGRSDRVSAPAGLPGVEASRRPA